jgi:hypothetical protein
MALQAAISNFDIELADAAINERRAATGGVTLGHLLSLLG